MLKNFAQSLNKAYSAPLSLVSLTNTPVFFKSKIKRSKKEILKRYLQNPRYKRVVKMRVPDVKGENVVFPINVTLRQRFVYRPTRNPIKMPEHDFIDFRKLTGNEILLNLSNVEYLRPTELASALLELTQRDGFNDVDWNNHEWIQKCVEVVTKHCGQYNPRVISTILWAFHRMNIKEPLLWSSLARESNKTVHKLQAKGLGATFIVFTAEPDRCTREFKERLASLLPIHMKKMNPFLVTKCFEGMLKEKLMTEYLFEENFFMIIWKRNHWLGARHYPSITRGMIEYGYKKDLEFWQKDFIPSFEKLADKATAEEAQSLIDTLNYIKENIPEVEVHHQVELLKKRIVFVNTTLKNIENAKFWNIVKNDIEYYRQREKLRMEKERTQATA